MKGLCIYVSILFFIQYLIVVTDKKMNTSTKLITLVMYTPVILFAILTYKGL